MSTPIQLFFAWRVWLFTKSKILPVIIATFALVSLGPYLRGLFQYRRFLTFLSRRHMDDLWHRHGQIVQPKTRTPHIRSSLVPYSLRGWCPDYGCISFRFGRWKKENECEFVWYFVHSTKRRQALLRLTMSSQKLFAVRCFILFFQYYSHTMAVTVQTGLLTTVFALGDVIFFMSEFPSSLKDLFWTSFLKLYLYVLDFEVPF